MLSTFYEQNPVFGRHAPLILGWSDEQLLPLVQRLSPVLADGLTEQTQLAIAAVARSLVVDRKAAGPGLHYARGKDPYSRPLRYRDKDPRATWWFVTRAIDCLEAAGLITSAVGRWSPNGRGRQSVAQATDVLVALLGPLIDIDEPRAAPFKVETVVLRDRAEKRPIDYPETAETAALREQVQIVNDALAQLDLYLFGRRRDIPIGRRIFNGSFERGGRLYFHGWSVQNVPPMNVYNCNCLSTVATTPWSKSTTPRSRSRWPIPKPGNRSPKATSITSTASVGNWSRKERTLS